MALRDAALISAEELSLFASHCHPKTKPNVSEGPVSGKHWTPSSVIFLTAVVLVAAVAAVVGSVTLPKLGFATAVFTPELGGVALCGQEEEGSTCVPARGHGCPSQSALTAVVLVAVVAAVVPAVASQRLVEAQVVVAPEAPGTSWTGQEERHRDRKRGRERELGGSQPYGRWGRRPCTRLGNPGPRGRRPS